jgi:hypothetical protein
MSRKVKVTAAIAAVIGLFGTGIVTGAGVNAAPAPVGQGFTVTPSDLAFILKQIKIAERHSRAFLHSDPSIPANPNPLSDPEYCSSLVGPGPDQILAAPASPVLTAMKWNRPLSLVRRNRRRFVAAGRFRELR